MARKVLYVPTHYPEISETYMETEIRALSGRFDVEILTMGMPDTPYEWQWHHPYRTVKTEDELIAAAREARPDIVHSHYTTQIPLVSRLARNLDVPFTIRSHSFDVFGPSTRKLPEYRDAVNSGLCAGVLGFPPTMELFERAGWDKRKAIPCHPVIQYDWFYDSSPNGTAIMNTGACLPKKKMEDFVHLGKLMPDRRFNLYPLGYSTKTVEALNDQLGRPINIMAPVEPKRMPAEYKKHQWLVYTGKDLTVGWPMAVAEAQASGVGVCLKRVRPDVEDYVGGAGYLFDTVEEAAEIIAGPVPDDIRHQGFLQAKKSDIHTHIDLLVNLWRAAF